MKKPKLAYEKISQAIRESIQNFELLPDELIPSETELAKKYKVSIGTVKKAVNDLVQEKLIYRIQGKGTYVSGSFLRDDKLRFYKILNKFDEKENISTQFQFLGCEVVTGCKAAYECLNLQDNAPLVRIDRLIYYNNHPYIYIKSFFDYAVFKDLLNIEPEVFERKALTLIIENNFKIATRSTKELITAIPIPADAAQILQQPAESPVLFISMELLTHNNIVYEYRESFISSGTKIYREYF